MRSTAIPVKTGRRKRTVSDFKKLKILVTIVPRRKTEFFVDFLLGFEVNFQSVMLGQGTAKSETSHLLGLEDTDKSVLVSFIREDRAEDALRGLDEKFHTVKGGKGIAFTLPVSSVIGVATYGFLSNNKAVVSEDKNNGK